MTTIRNLIVVSFVSFFFFSVLQVAAQNNPRAGSQSSVEVGVITSMTAVTSQGQASTGRTLAGGAGGGLLGNQVGGGSGKKIATGAGAVLGAKRANRKSAESNTQQNVEFLIQLNNGRTVSVVQSQSIAQGFRKGDKVNVITGADGVTRITRS